MNHIEQVADGQVITISRGVYRQVPLFRRKSKDGRYQPFAKHGGGFVRLLCKGGATVPAMTWLEIDAPDHDVVESGGQLWVDPQ